MGLLTVIAAAATGILTLQQPAPDARHDARNVKGWQRAQPPASPITVTSPVPGAGVKMTFTITGRAPAGENVFVSTAVRATGRLGPWSMTKWTEPDASGNFVLKDFTLESDTPVEFSLLVYHVKDDKRTDVVTIPLKITP